MNSIRIATGWRKRIDDQQVYSMLKKFTGFCNECIECMPAGFVSRRDNLKHCNDAIAAHVAHGNGALLAPIEFRVRLGGELRLRTSLWFCRHAALIAVLGRCLQCEYVGAKPCSL